MTFVLGRMPRSSAGKDAVPLKPDDPVGAYLLASKKSQDQRDDELRTAAKIGTPAPGRMGKGWPVR